MIRDLPTIRGTQIGLKNPAIVDRIKDQMRSGQFPYHEIGCRVEGIRDLEGTYHVREGHHRMAAAMELYKENADSSFVRNLLTWGVWAEWDYPPHDSRPLPSRSWWGAFRNSLNF